MTNLKVLANLGKFNVLSNAININELEGIDCELDNLLAFGKAKLRGSDQKWCAKTDDPIIVSERSDNNKICRIEYLKGASLIFSDLVSSKLQQLAESIAGVPMVLFKDKCNFKLPRSGAFPPHQDITAYKHFGAQYHLTIAISVDDATIENGCLEFAPNYINDLELNVLGEDKYENAILPAYISGNRNGDIQESYVSQLNWENVLSKRGDVIIFDSYIPHRSSLNNTDSNRRMLFFTFVPDIKKDFYSEYYLRKRKSPDDPIFHVSTPTIHKNVNIED